MLLRSLCFPLLDALPMRPGFRNAVNVLPPVFAVGDLRTQCTESVRTPLWSVSFIAVLRADVAHEAIVHRLSHASFT